MLKEAEESKAGGGGGELTYRQSVGWMMEELWSLMSKRVGKPGAMMIQAAESDWSRDKHWTQVMRFCFSVANCRLFGDESDLHFWTVASHYIQSFAQARQLTVSAAEGQAQSEGVQPSPQSHLDICHDVLCETSYFQVSIIRENGESVYLCLVLSLWWAEKVKTDKFQPTLEKKKSPQESSQRQSMSSSQTMHKQTQTACPLSSTVSISPRSNSAFCY